MKVLWAIFCITLAAILELTAGNFRLPIPLIAAVCFYLTVVYQWKVAVAACLLPAGMVDAFLGRPAPCTAMLLAGAAALGVFWKHEGDCRKAALQLLPGLLFGGIAVLWLVICRLLVNAGLQGGGFLGEATLMMRLGLCALLSIPVTATLLDALARRLDLPRYENAQQKWEAPHGT